MVAADKKICIFGTGGCGREALCLLIDANTTGRKIADLACFMVSDSQYSETEIMGVEVIPFSKFDSDRYVVVVAIGDPNTRQRAVEKLPEGTEFITLIHPSAIVSDWVEIGEGSLIAAGCILTCNIKIGKHAHLNLKTTITHDNTFGDYFTTAPGVNISGNCTFGNSVYFGTNASVKQGVTICNNVTVGMGAVVVKSIEEAGVYVGNPAQRLK